MEGFLHWMLTEVDHEDAKGAKVWFCRVGLFRGMWLFSGFGFGDRANQEIGVSRMVLGYPLTTLNAPFRGPARGHWPWWGCQASGFSVPMAWRRCSQAASYQRRMVRSSTWKSSAIWGVDQLW